MKKNILAWLMALCLLVSALPVQAVSNEVQNIDAEVAELTGDEGAELPDDDAEIEEEQAIDPEIGEGSALLESELSRQAVAADEAGLKLSELLQEFGQLIFGDGSGDPTNDTQTTPARDGGDENAPAREEPGDEAQTDADGEPAQSGKEQLSDAEATAKQGEDVPGENGEDVPDQQGTSPEAMTDIPAEAEDEEEKVPVDSEAEAIGEDEAAADEEPSEDAENQTAGDVEVGSDGEGDAREVSEEMTGEEGDGEAQEASEGDGEGGAQGDAGDTAAEPADSDEQQSDTGETVQAEAQDVEEKIEEQTEEALEEKVETVAEETAQDAMEAQATAETPLTLDKTALTLPINETSVLTAAGGTGSVTWTSEDTSVARVDDNGVVTAVAVGSTRVVATDSNKAAAACEISVVQAFTGAVFEVRTLAIGLGETVDLSGYASISAAAFKGVSLSSADGGIAAVGADGKVTGAALGETRITAAYNGQQDAIVLSVKPAPTAITLPYATLRIGKGDRVRIRANLGDGASTLTCTSSKKKIVKVAKGGVIKGVRKGTAYITVKTFNGLRARVKVVVKNAPRSVTPNPNPLNLGVGETFTLGYKTSKGTAGSVRFTGDNPAAFTVDEFTGDITGVAPGSGTVTLTTFNGKVATCPVTVMAAPTTVAFDPNTISVAKKKKVQIKMVFNEGAWSNVTFESDNPGIARVSAAGVVTGVTVGQTVIRAKTFVPGLVAETTFTVMGPPSKVWLDQKSMGANVGEPFQLEPRIPAGSQTTFKYKSSKPKVASVSADGVVTPRKKGTTKITITTHNKKKCTLKLTVADPGQVSAVTRVGADDPVLVVGDTWQVEYTVTPEGVDPMLKWTSSNEGVATVSDTGLVQAVGYGVTTIKAVSSRNEQVSMKFTLSVQTRELTLAIPARTTEISGIAANLEMIDDIRKSALSEIDRLKTDGALTSDTASRRKEIVNAIFENYAFPWMTPSKQSYWKAANSENGLKDFKPDRVYYGLPYISGSGANRHYSAAQALSEERYTNSGQGYYVLNKGKYLNGKYVGNDCSGLVNVSIWGTSGEHVADRTSDIATNAAYKTVASYSDMLPGDLICKGNAHVVMFLYYASTDKSKIMIIENGGSEKGTNTVHCDIKTASAYQKSGYKVRRLATLD